MTSKPMKFLKKLVLATTIAGSVMFSNKLLTQEPKLPTDLTKIPNIKPNGWGVQANKYINDTTKFVNPDNNFPGSMIFEGAIEKKGNRWNLKINSIQYSQDYRFYYNQPDANIISLYGSIHDDNALKMRITSVNSDYSKVEMESMDSMSKVQKVEFRNGWNIEDVWNNNSVRNYDFKDWIALVSDIKLELINGKTTQYFTLTFKQEFDKPLVIRMLDSTGDGRLQLPIANVCLVVPTIEPDWIMKLTSERDFKINLATTIAPKPIYAYEDIIIPYALVGRIERLGGFGERAKVADPDYKYTEHKQNPSRWPFDSVNGMYGENFSYPEEFVFSLDNQDGKLFSAYKSKYGNPIKDTAFHMFEPYVLGWSSLTFINTNGWADGWRSKYIKQDTALVAVKNSVGWSGRSNKSIYPYRREYSQAALMYDFSKSTEKSRTFGFRRRLEEKFRSTSKYDASTGINTSFDTIFVENLNLSFRFDFDSTCNRYFVGGNEFAFEKKYTTILSLKDVDEYGDPIYRTNISTRDLGTGTSNSMLSSDSIKVVVLDSSTIQILYNELFRPILAAGAYETLAPFKGVRLIEPSDNSFFYNQDSLHFRWSSAPDGFKYHFYLSLYDDATYNSIIDSLMQDTTIVIKKPEQTPGREVEYYWKVMAEHKDGSVGSSTYAFIAKDTLTTEVDDYKQEQFRIFPNPADGLSTVEFPEAIINQSLKVYDYLGNCIMTVPVKAGETTSYFYTSELPNGIYEIYLGENHARLVVMK